MIYVLYCLFNSFGLGKKPLLFDEKKPRSIKTTKMVNASTERFNEILSTITKAKKDGLETNKDGREITLDNAESFLKSIASGEINKSQFK